MNNDEENKKLSLPEDLTTNLNELYEKITHPKPEPREDKPKILNVCGDCVAFHTPFCTWEENNPDHPPYTRTPILRTDAACCRFYPGMKNLKVKAPKFDEVVDNL